MSAALLKYLFPIIAVAVISSCKKNENSGTCKLKTVHIIAGQYDATTTLEYDPQARVVKATTTGAPIKQAPSAIEMTPLRLKRKRAATALHTYCNKKCSGQY